MPLRHAVVDLRHVRDAVELEQLPDERTNLRRVLLAEPLNRLRRRVLVPRLPDQHRPPCLPQAGDAPRVRAPRRCQVRPRSRRRLPNGVQRGVLFTLIHVPLAVAGVQGPAEALRTMLLVGAAAVGLRLVIARLHSWTGGCLLAVGLLHSSFNASESLLEPAYDWVRIVALLALAMVAVAFVGRSSHGGGSPEGGRAESSLSTDFPWTRGSTTSEPPA